MDNTSRGAGEWLYSSLLQPWLIALILILLAFVLAGMIWRKRSTKYDAAKNLYGHWHAAVPRYRRSQARMTAELERARRYRHPLTVIVLAVDYEQHKQKKKHLVSISGNAEFSSPFFFSLVSALLRDNARGSDLVSYDVTNDCYVMMLPESDTAAAEKAVARMQELIVQRAKVTLQFGIAEYPADGLILADLVSRAHARSQRTACETSPQIDAAETNNQGSQRMESLVPSVKRVQ